MKNTTNRRSFMKALAAIPAVAMLGRSRPAFAALPKAKITKVNIYRPPILTPQINQSNMVVTIETDQAGLIGVGEGGVADLLTICAHRLIGKNPFDIERCWQDMYRVWHYPPGKERIHALGALDMALWDIKGKALGVPVYDLMGGMNRNYLECYASGGPGESQQVRERARQAMEEGFRVFRMDAASIPGGGRGGRGGPATVESVAPSTGPAMLYPGPVYNGIERVRQVAKDCKDMREGVGPNGDFMIDFHQRFDFANSIRCCKLVEEFEPYCVEDPTRVEQFIDDIPKLRKLTTVPLAAGEEWGQRWDFNKLVENHDLDYIRSTLPNTGGITEMVKVAALCETHAIGIIPHFTGPIATAALVHAIGPYSGPVLVEIGPNRTVPQHLNEGLTFRNGKIWPNGRPGLGCSLNMAQLTLLATIDAPGPNRTTYFRPDGSQQMW